MKTVLQLVLVVAMAAAVQAVVVDDFEDTTLSEYTKSVMLEQSGTNAITFESPSGVLQVSKASDSGAEQVLFLRDDYSLGLGQTLRIDATVASVSGYTDFGIAVSAEVDPEDVVWSSGTADGRQDYLYMYIKGGSSGWGCIGFDGTDLVDGSGYVTSQDLSVVTGLFIRRTADTVFEVGYSTADGDTIFKTLTVPVLSGSYNAIGFYADLRTETTYGDFDNLRIESDPYGPEVEEGIPSGSILPITLTWNAAADPTGTYTVYEDIINQQVFVGIETDPNLLYIGETGDPGTEDPSSSITFDGTFDETYRWIVVEVLDGYGQTLSVGDSIELVDPNNIIGPEWTFDSSPSAPQVVTQPVDQRVFTTDPNAVFSFDYTSANDVTVTWYKDDVALTGSEADVTIETTSTSSILTIDTPELTDEGKYYCEVVLVEDENTSAQTATRMLVIKQELARFEFEGNLDDTSGNGAPSGVLKTVSLADPNELLASVVASPTYVTGIEGDAISLDGTQFVDLDPNGYPKAGLLDTIGDVRGEGYEKQGFGRGMDEGSILLWVKPASTGAIIGNANAGYVDHFALTSNDTNNARIVVRGQNWDDSYNGGNSASGSLGKTDFSLQDGYWHMIAATWENDGGAKLYINGELVASGSGDYTEKFLPWERSNLLGASRSTATARHILADFLTGAVDSLRVYNYEISADEIATEYMTKNELGLAPCDNPNFAGSDLNFDNAGGSYCKIDLADFAVFAASWLTDGLYELP